ncbi:hypothetical protein Tco_1380704, partial [Tanacetum coccineum]
ERKYPLTKETLERMMSLKLIAESASESAYNLLRFIQKHIDEYGSYDGINLDLSRLATTLNRLERSIQIGINTTPRMSCFCLTRIIALAVWRKGLPKIRETLLSSSILRITKSEGKVNLPTSTSIFLAIPTGYWNDQLANLTLILVGLRVSRDNFAYKEYGMRLMLAPRSARSLHEKSLLKLHGMRKLPGSPSFGGTLF